MSITGNPAHLGHMAAVATAVNELAKQKIRPTKIRISLAGQPYVAGKCSQTGEVGLPFKLREQILKQTITEAVRLEMFQKVEADFWEDGNNETVFVDHPVAYSRMQKELRKDETSVIFVGGDDLADNMESKGAWKGIKHAIIVSRSDNQPKEGDAQLSDEGIPTRIRVASIFPEYADLSSSNIRRGDVSGLATEGLRKEFGPRFRKLSGVKPQ